MLRRIAGVLLVVHVLTFLFAPPGESQQTVPSISSASTPHTEGALVVFDEERLFEVYDKLGPFTPQDRAQAITDRIARLANDPFTRIYPVIAVDRETTSELVYGDMVIMTVTDRDAQPTGTNRQDLAKSYADILQRTIAKSREQLTLRSLAVNTGLVLLDTAILIGLLILFHKAFPKIYAKIWTWPGPVLRPIKIQRVELLSAHQLAAGLIGAIKLVRVAAVLILVYVYLTTALGIFPWTRGISASLLDAVISTLTAIGQAFANYIPDVISIAVIVVVTRYILKLIALLFTGLERGAITMEGFHRDWAQPTYKIIRFLVIVFAAIAAFPYIPGSQSEGFRGISVFLGLLISLGSAAAIGNIVAGVVLTYMRPFRVGDRVKIADTMGDVMEKTLLVTRVRTIKNVDVTIPNAMVLGSHLVNYSSCAQEQGLILHTSVTIGYDVPWKTVHELLIAAARATPSIMPNPEPFVLQTSLDDFFVTYEINAYTDQPNSMATIYAALHQRIQDHFNEAGVEILSPHYAQIRDGNKVTIPDQYLPKNYQAPGIRLEGLSALLGKAQPSLKGDAKP